MSTKGTRGRGSSFDSFSFSHHGVRLRNFGVGQAGGDCRLVSDASGAIIPGASVPAKNDATGGTLTTVSTDAGLYSFISLAPGSYDITVNAKGFGPVVRQGVVVSVDQVSTINFTLAVGTVNQVVTVTSNTDLVDTSNSTVGQLIGAATIDRVPLLTRNVYDLIQLSAGVTPANGASNSSSSYISRTFRADAREWMSRRTR